MMTVWPIRRHDTMGPYFSFHSLYVRHGRAMSMSPTFPRNGSDFGPGGRGSPVNFLEKDQRYISNKAIAARI